MLFTLFGKDNLMTPGPYPAECPRLTWIEELLVAPVISHMSFAPLSSGSLCYKGNCINFPQNNNNFADQLPRLPKDIGVLLIKTKDRNLNDKFLEVDRHRVERFLRFVKERNLPGWNLITISEENLASLDLYDPSQLPSIIDEATESAKVFEESAFDANEDDEAVDSVDVDDDGRLAHCSTKS